jgi:predicted TIM-barrel fold metal-dependent hydrolase
LLIIDSHAHIFPPKIEQIATAAIGDFYERPMRHSGSIEQLLESGRRAGVSKYLVFSTATTAAQVEKINDFILEQCNIHSEFIGAGTMHRDYANFQQELSRIYAAGIRGIKFHPDFQKFNIDCDELFPVFEYIQDLGMFIITHSGDVRYGYSAPARVARIASAFPKMNVIAAHFGGWSEWDVGLRELAHLPNIYVDTSSTYGFGGLEPMRAGLKSFAPSHIFFGCDFPMWDHAEELQTLRRTGISDEMLGNVAGKNFEAFYSLYK